MLIIKKIIHLFFSLLLYIIYYPVLYIIQVDHLAALILFINF